MCSVAGCEKLIHAKGYCARGISVWAAWFEDFLTFQDWAVANGYRIGLELDRKDVDGDYCPANCEWVTKAENNQRRWDSQKAKQQEKQ